MEVEIVLFPLGGKHVCHYVDGVTNLQHEHHAPYFDFTRVLNLDMEKEMLVFIALRPHVIKSKQQKVVHSLPTPSCLECKSITSVSFLTWLRA